MSCLHDNHSQPSKKENDYLRESGKIPGGYLFTGRRGKARNLTTRQYARLVSQWIESIGLDQSLFGTHSLRRTKATLIYRRTGNLRAVKPFLGHTKIESTVIKYTKPDEPDPLLAQNATCPILFDDGQ